MARRHQVGERGVATVALEVDAPSHGEAPEEGEALCLAGIEESVAGREEDSLPHAIRPVQQIAARVSSAIVVWRTSASENGT